MIKMDGFDDCVLGVVNIVGQEPRLVYDTQRVIEKLQSSSEMTEEEAWEYWEYNQLGAYVGEDSPAFFESYPDLETIEEHYSYE